MIYGLQHDPRSCVILYSVTGTSLRLILLVIRVTTSRFTVLSSSVAHNPFVSSPRGFSLRPEPTLARPVLEVPLVLIDPPVPPTLSRKPRVLCVYFSHLYTFECYTYLLSCVLHVHPTTRHLRSFRISRDTRYTPLLSRTLPLPTCRDEKSPFRDDVVPPIYPLPSDPRV